MKMNIQPDWFFVVYWASVMSAGIGLFFFLMLNPYLIMVAGFAALILVVVLAYAYWAMMQ